MLSALQSAYASLVCSTVVVLLLVNPGYAFAVFQSSTFTLVGGVRNEAGLTVSGVRVAVIDEDMQTFYTAFVDSVGRFTAKGLKPGRFTIRIETTGTPYQEYSQPLELQGGRKSGANEDVMLDIVLRYKRGEGPPAHAGSTFAQEVPKAARTEMEHGARDLKSNKIEPAIASLKKALEIFPDYFDALELLGVEYVKGGQSEAALPLLTRATDINKRAPKSAYALGVAYLKLNRLPEAIVWLEKSAVMDAANPNTHMMLGLAYGNSGAADKSEAALKKALQVAGPAAAEAHYYLTGLYNKQERYREAWKELELYLREAKNVKEPAQVKAMIAKLKEKEKAQTTQAPISTASAPQSDNTGPSPATTAGLNDASTSVANRTTGEPAEPVAPVAPVAPAAPTAAAGAATLGPVPPLPSEYIEVLRQAEASGEVLHKLMLDYTYQLKKIHSVLNERGAPIHKDEQVFEAYPIRGEHVLVSLSRNGVPSRATSEERNQAGRLLEEAERRSKSELPSEKSSETEAGGYVSAGVTGASQGRSGYVSINISTILRSCEFFSPRVETIDGRETIVMNYRHRAEVKLARNHAYIAGLVGSVWIDQVDKTVTRVEGWPVSAAAFDLVQSIATHDNAALIYQQTRQPDGSWFPSMIRMNAGGRTDLFDGLNLDVIFEFSNYRRFKTTANEKLDDPSKP